MVCTKEFSITVTDQSFLFVWDNAFIDPGSGSADFTPSNTTGNVARAFTEIAGVPGGALVVNDGHITWNSNAIVPCNAHFEVIGADGNPDPLMNWGVAIQVLAPAIVLVQEQGTSLGFNGSFDVPFDLPNTGGADWTIRWTQDSFVTSNPAGAGSIDLTVTVAAL